MYECTNVRMYSSWGVSAPPDPPFLSAFGDTDGYELVSNQRLAVRTVVGTNIWEFFFLAVRTVVGKNIWEFWTQTKNEKNEVWLKRRRMSLRSFLVLFHQN